MKIIKQGVKLHETEKFACRSCGCIFIAESGEFSITALKSAGLAYKCDCPNCGKNCYNLYPGIEEVDSDVGKDTGNR